MSAIDNKPEETTTVAATEEQIPAKAQEQDAESDGFEPNEETKEPAEADAEGEEPADVKDTAKDEVDILNDTLKESGDADAAGKSKKRKLAEITKDADAVKDVDAA